MWVKEKKNNKCEQCPCHAFYFLSYPCPHRHSHTMRDPNTMMVLHEWFHVTYCQSKIVACWQEQYQQIIRCRRDRNEQKKDGYERRGEEDRRRKNDNCMPFTILSLLVCRQCIVLWWYTMMSFFCQTEAGMARVAQLYQIQTDLTKTLGWTATRFSDSHTFWGLEDGLLL